MALIVPKLNKAVASAAEIPAALRSAGVAYTTIDNVNWPEAFPYKPKVEFAAAHCGDALLLHYRVEEQSVRAVARQDHEHIWEDACVEFFCIVARLPSNCLYVSRATPTTIKIPVPPMAPPALNPVTF